MKKAGKIGIIIFGALLVLGLVSYIIFFGVTPRQKYYKCVDTCEKSLLQESSKQYCPQRCLEVTGYNPTNDASEEKTKKDDSTKDLDTTSKDQKSGTGSVKEDGGITYYCEWSWPQKIINYDTKEVIEFCTSEKPWCNYADRTYETVACCGDYEESTKTYSNCNLLKDIQH